MRAPLILSILLLFVTPVVAQKGYIILDSTYARGFIESQVGSLNQTQVKFHRSLAVAITTYDPADIRNMDMVTKYMLAEQFPPILERLHIF